MLNTDCSPQSYVWRLLTRCFSVTAPPGHLSLHSHLSQHCSSSAPNPVTEGRLSCSFLWGLKTEFPLRCHSHHLWVNDVVPASKRGNKWESFGRAGNIISSHHLQVGSSQMLGLFHFLTLKTCYSTERNNTSAAQSCQVQTNFHRGHPRSLSYFP